MSDRLPEHYQGCYHSLPAGTAGTTGTESPNGTPRTGAASDFPQSLLKAPFSQTYVDARLAQMRWFRILLPWLTFRRRVGDLLVRAGEAIR